MASNIPMVLANVLPMILSFTETLRANFGQLVDAGMELLLNLAQGIANALPTLVEYIPSIVSNIAGLINDNAPKILETGFKVIVTLVEGLINAIPTIVANMPKIISAIWDTITAINWVNLGLKVIGLLKEGIVRMGPQVKESVVEFGKSAWEHFKNIDWLNLGKDVITFIKSGLVGVGGWIVDGLVGIGREAWNCFTNIDWLDLGKNIIDGIVKGLSNAGGAVIDFLKDLAGSALDSVLDFFGIHSPSRVFRDQVGKMLMLGMANGIEENISAVEDAMNLANKETLGIADTDLSYFNEMDLTPATAESAFDYDRLINGLYEALSAVTVMMQADVNGKTLATAAAPLINVELAKQAVKDRRGS